MLKNLGQLSESFRQFRQNSILTVESKFYWELFIVRTMLFGMIFRILGEWMSSFSRNCSCTSVRTAFYVNKRKAFLSILMRKLCFPKCLYFFKICRIRSNIFPVFLHWIFWQGCQSCIQVYRGPFHGENQSETTFFSKTFFFGFWTKSTRTFHIISLADFKKTVLRVQRTVSEKAWDKKRANKQNYFQELVLTTFGLLVEFLRPFCQNCFLPSSNFLMESSNCEWKIDY